MKKGLILAASLFFAAQAPAEVIDIGNDELKSLTEQGIALVDIRTPGEWKETGVVAGSQLVTLIIDAKGQVDADAFTQQFNAVVAADRPAVLICRSGNRTKAAAKMLEAATPGRKIYNVKQGLKGWLAAAQPVIPLQQNLQTAGIKCSPQC